MDKDLCKAPAHTKFFAETASRMCIPLVSFGQTLGVLALDSAKVDAFRDGDQQSLESVADICATAIQNAHYVDRVKQLAYLDGLTGIFNRRFFELRIMEEIERARRYGTGMAVIMADIDEFKRLNDEFGHVLGDEVLRQVSSLFHQQLRKVGCGVPLWRRGVWHPVDPGQATTGHGGGGKTPQDGGGLAVSGRAPDRDHQRWSRNFSPTRHHPRRARKGRGQCPICRQAGWTQ